MSTNQPQVDVEAISNGLGVQGPESFSRCRPVRNRSKLHPESMHGDLPGEVFLSPAKPKYLS